MREYELVLMLDPGQDAPARDAVAKEAKRQIEADGALKHENEWGLRKMAYEIAQRNEADYRWFRFEAPTPLLEQLDHNLKIADGVLRFRIFKVGPGTPVIAPPAIAAPGPSASRERPAESEAAPPAAESPPEAAPQPADETAVAEQPAAETAIAEEPTAETAVAEEPAGEPAPAEQSVEETAAEPAETPAEPVADESPDAAPEAPPEPAADEAEGDKPAQSAQ
jgi:small subunit ribosomal protein S6